MGRTRNASWGNPPTNRPNLERRRPAPQLEKVTVENLLRFDRAAAEPAARIGRQVHLVLPGAASPIVPPGEMVLIEFALVMNYFSSDGNVEIDFSSSDFNILSPFAAVTILS